MDDDLIKRDDPNSVRRGEDTKTHFRSDRIINMNGQYYYITRENTQEGPFDSKNEANNELLLYIRRMSDPNRIKKSD